MSGRFESGAVATLYFLFSMIARPVLSVDLTDGEHHAWTVYVGGWSRFSLRWTSTTFANLTTPGVEARFECSTLKLLFSPREGLGKIKHVNASLVSIRVLLRNFGGVWYNCWWAAGGVVVDPCVIDTIEIDQLHRISGYYHLIIFLFTTSFQKTLLV